MVNGTQWLAKYSCSQPGVQPPNEWSVRGFYDDKFEDHWNLNLSGNTVSLITAIATSFSIILFVDIVFRVNVRAKNGRPRPDVVQRRQVLDNFSNPINLLSIVMRRFATRSTKSEDSRIKSPHHGLSRWTYVTLVFMGCLTVLVELMFILLATNQNKVFDLRLDAVPIFEFEDRGCEFLQPSAFVNTCDHIPLTEKSGFDSRATIQICSTATVHPSIASSLPSSSYFFILLTVMNYGGVQVTIMDRNRASTKETQMGIYVEQSRMFYTGMKDLTPESLLSALLTRLERTNVTVLTNSTSDVGGRSKTLVTVDDHLHRQSLINMVLRTQGTSGILSLVLVDASNVDLRETHLSLSISGEEDDDQKQSYMRNYFNDVTHSIMFPTGKARGVFSLREEILFLDEDPTPLVYSNRPWIGVVVSVIICCALLLIWAVVAVLGIEGNVNNLLAWERFFKDKEITNVEDMGERGI